MHVSRVSTGNFEMERWLIHNSSLEKETKLSHPIRMFCNPLFLCQRPGASRKTAEIDENIEAL